MMRDGSPIYPLGSLQDRAMQLSLMKDQRVEIHKFVVDAQIKLIASMMPHSQKPQLLTDSVDKLIEQIPYYLSYDEETVETMERLRDQHWGNMQKTVDNFPSKTISVKN